MTAGVLLALAPNAAAAPWLAVVPNAGDNTSQVTPIDLLTNLAAPSLATPGGVTALGVAIAPDARTAYVVDVGSQVLTAVDLTKSPPRVTSTVSLATAGITRSPIYLAITPDGRRAYTSDVADNVVLPIDLTTSKPKVGTPIKVGKGPSQMAMAPDGRTLYVVDSGGNSVTPIDVRTEHAESAITGVPAGQGAIAITPDGRRALVASNTLPEVIPITLASARTSTPIALPTIPLGIAITPDGRRAYTANFGPASRFAGTGSTVTPIDLATDTALASITVGSGPWAIAITPDGRTAYTTNSNDGTSTPIDIATDTAGPAIAGVAGGGRSIAITPDQPPAPRFTAARANPGAPVAFDASASTIRFNAITAYAWDFHDGTPVVHTATPAITHAYAGAGLHEATVTETGAGGVAGAATDTFAVGASALSPPVLGRTVLADPRGHVLVRRPGARRFVALRSTADLPTGSQLDTRHGSVAVTVAHDAGQRTDTATVTGGIFATTQTRRAPALTTFRLTQRLRGCPATARASIARRRPGRRIAVRDTGGHFATRGHYVAASVQGTSWTTADACASSTVAVHTGLVRVTDLVRHTTHLLGAGERYTARRR